MTDLEKILEGFRAEDISDTRKMLELVENVKAHLERLSGLYGGPVEVLDCLALVRAECKYLHARLAQLGAE